MDHQNLWAPWRMEYLRQLETEDDKQDRDSGCFLCEAARGGESDENLRRLVIHRDGRGLILLNRFPYTNGHLLVAVGEHLPDLTDLTADQRAGLLELVTAAESLLRTAVNPQGINIGINIGRCAGAGVPGHLHVHVVPRWAGDVNFMHVVGNVRVIPQALEESHAHLAATWQRLTASREEEP